MKLGKGFYITQSKYKINQSYGLHFITAYRGARAIKTLH